MKILGIIPSRYASVRFPAKAMNLILGKTMIQRVYEQSVKAKSLSKVIVATDHPMIFDHVQSFGGEVVMTGSHHLSGTDRCNEALHLVNEPFDFVINIQGDEPFIKPEQIDLLGSSLDPEIQLSTLIIASKHESDLNNPNIVKVVFNKNQQAIYFSRSPIPFLRNCPEGQWLAQHHFYRHVGIYAYRSDILKKITLLPPSLLELAESLEQLRWLENNFKIQVNITNIESFGVDTPEDLEKILLQKDIIDGLA